jgi:hypothetical protein
MTVKGAVPQRSQPVRHRGPAHVLRALAVLGLAVDVYVHLKLAPVFDQLGTQITQGALFRVEAALAAAAGLYLALRDSRRAWLLAGLIAVAGLVAILVTRWVALPALGPLPAMYDPTWSADKVLVTVGMLVTALAWPVREALRSDDAGADTADDTGPAHP